MSKSRPDRRTARSPRRALPGRGIGGVVLTLVAAIAFPPPGRSAEDPPAGGNPAPEILRRLDARLAGLTTMRGRFVQSFVSAGLGAPQSESGRFYLLRPDRMRWDYTSPETKTAVSDGVNTWLHVPEENVVYRGTVAAWKRGGAFSILAGGRLDSAYEAVSAGADGALRRGDVVLVLRPRAAREEFEEIRLEIEPKRLDVVAVTAVDGMGNRIGVVLSDVEENPRLSPDLFRFAPPPGARVVDQEPPAAP